MRCTFANPHVEALSYSLWPQLEGGDLELEFHLVYQGPLPAAGQGGGKTRSREKHDMRKIFHPQIAALWRMHPFLSDFVDRDKKAVPGEPTHGYENRYLKCGYRFIPLVSDFLMVACALDITFLRRDGPGSLIKSGGDIDNRLKVLFDALRMPQTCDEVCGDSPSADEDPFYVLLEDDKLISKVQVETNWLLTPPAASDVHDVHLLIRVKTIVTGSAKYEAAFL
jgi:hypothetical protein